VDYEFCMEFLLQFCLKFMCASKRETLTEIKKPVKSESLRGKGEKYRLNGLVRALQGLKDETLTAHRFSKKSVVLPTYRPPT
jgi:hypothetical protein